MNYTKSLQTFIFVIFLLSLVGAASAAAPIISAPSPANGATGVNFNTPLLFTVDDADGDLMNITVQLYNGTTWLKMKDVTNATSGVHNATTIGFTAKALTNYIWNVTASDNNGNVVQQSFSFTTKNYQNIASLKWRTLFPNADAGQMMPVMGDVDNDGVQEIVVASGVQLTVLNGITGAIEWSRPLNMTDTSAAELADIDGDGVPEILALTKAEDGPDPGSAADLHLRAFDGFGNTIWTSDSVGGDAGSLYPITTADIDGDGFPEIYVTTEDTYAVSTGILFSGNMADYQGRASKVDHNGNVLAQQWTYHPCWGGVSLADVNFDGNFEVYVGDRRGPYNGGFPSRGPHSYDAETMDLLWGRPDLQHSSPMVVLADVTGDDSLEAIASPITIRGPVVIDPTATVPTGLTIPNVLDVNNQTEANEYLAAIPKGVTVPGMDYSTGANNRRLPTHGTPTVYDINEDGNMDIIYSTAYPDSAPKNFTVFDLVTGQRIFDTTMDVPANWPPRMGDVTGDGKADILVATGYQGSGKVYQLHIYDSSFNLITSMNIASLGQLITALVVDTDNDGLSEIVIAGVKGIAVYETTAPAPEGVNSWAQLYSSYRNGVAVHVDGPGPKAPLIRDASPVDGSTDVALGPVLSVRAHDFQFKTMNVVFEVNNGVDWVVVANHTNVANGNYNANTAAVVTAANTTYSWRVTATDADGLQSQAVFSFTTDDSGVVIDPFDAWSYKRPITIDDAQIVGGDQVNFPVLVKVTVDSANAQSDGDDFVFADASNGVLAHEIENYNSATGELIAWVKVPVLSSSADTVLTMYYGNNVASNQENVAGVWDANYVAVHHLEEPAGSVLDSSASGKNGVAVNGVNQNAVGKIGPGYRFDGSNDRVDVSQTLSGSGPFTFEAWYNTGNKQGYVMAQRDTLSQGAFIQYFTDGTIQFYVNNQFAKRATSTSAWHRIAGTFDGSTASLYVDDNTPISVFGASVMMPNLPTVIGDRSNLGRAFLGDLDEVRVSNVARSEGFLRTSFRNQNDPSTFMAVGAEVLN